MIHAKPRAPGIRSALARTFISALEADFARHGLGVIEKLRDERPHDYLKIVVSLLPDEAVPETTLEDLTDDELTTVLNAVRSLIAEKSTVADRERGGSANDGDAT